MRRVLLILTLFVLLLPTADMVSTDSLVEWEIIASSTSPGRPMVYYPNGNLGVYIDAVNTIYNSSLKYDPENYIVNYRYYKYNETFSYYTEGLGTIEQAFYNPIKNTTYLVRPDFLIWKLNDTFYINQTEYGMDERMGMTWFNLTNQFEDFHRPLNRHGIKMVYDYKNNFIFLYGGYDGNIIYYADTWVFDINGGEWIQQTPLTQPGLRAFYGISYNENDGKIYLFGGKDYPNLYDDLWVYDYTINKWTEVSMNNSPGKRSGHGMIYDSYNNRILVYRGFNVETLKDLWVYDFKSKYWGFLAANTGPSASYDTFKDWIMYGNTSLIMTGDFYKLHLELGTSPPGTEIVVTHTETTTEATTSTDTVTDYTTITDQKTEINYEDVTRYQNITSLFEETTDETPFYSLGVFSIILAVLIRRKRSI